MDKTNTQGKVSKPGGQKDPQRNYKHDQKSYIHEKPTDVYNKYITNNKHITKIAWGFTLKVNPSQQARVGEETYHGVHRFSRVFNQAPF